MADELLTSREVAARLKIHPDSVRAFAVKFPDFPKKVKLFPGVTGSVRYRAADVDRFIADRIAASVTEAK